MLQIYNIRNAFVKYLCNYFYSYFYLIVDKGDGEC